jgi:NADPH-dependent 2,4-dienoyl-CoA reductase/sulfur reductase-like enzyme
MRLEHRTHAQEQGHAVAKNILGANEPFTPIPYFWTDQFESRVQVRGLIPPEAEGEIVEGDPDGDSFVQTFSVQGRPIGVLGWNAARLAMQHARQMSAV